MTCFVFAAILVLAFVWHKRIVKNKDAQLRFLAVDYAALMTQLEQSHAISMISDMQDEKVDESDMSKKQKAVQKQINKIMTWAANRCLENGAYSDEIIAAGKYVFTNQQAENTKSDNQLLMQLVSQAARISWTIADAASVDAANEGAVNIVNYQLEVLIAGYLEGFEETYGFDNVLNCVKTGLHFVQVSNEMRERIRILFPEKYQDKLFLNGPEQVDDEAGMNWVYYEVGGEERFDDLLDWGALNFGAEDWDKFKESYSKACDENDYDRIKNLILYVDEIRKLNESKNA